jgi:hypothetical protein
MTKDTVLQTKIINASYFTSLHLVENSFINILNCQEPVINTNTHMVHRY